MSKKNKKNKKNFRKEFPFDERALIESLCDLSKVKISYGNLDFKYHTKTEDSDEYLELLNYESNEKIPDSIFGIRVKKY